MTTIYTTGTCLLLLITEVSKHKKMKSALDLDDGFSKKQQQKSQHRF